MLIAGIDLATSEGSVALYDSEKGIGTEKAFLCKNDQSARVLPAIEKLLRKASASLSDVKAYATTSGPGSFTGLRVSLATIQGLCYGRNVPIITIGTLYATALFVCWTERKNVDLICPVLDAYRGDVYAALYRYEGNKEQILEELIAPAVYKPNELVNLLEADSEIVFAGAGWRTIKDFRRQRKCNWRDARGQKLRLALVCAKEASLRLAKGTEIPKPTLDYIKPPDIQMPKNRK